MSSNPTTLTSSGTRQPRLGERVQHPDGHLVVGHEYRCHVATFSPVRGRSRSRGPGSSPPPSAPGGRAPRRAWPPRSRCGGPRPRSSPSGPTTWSMARCPRSMRCWVAWRAPSIWSTPTLSPRPDRSPSTTISGSPASAECTTARASACAAIITIASTDWRARWSMALRSSSTVTSAKGHQAGEVAGGAGGLLHGPLDAGRAEQRAVGADDPDDSGAPRHQGARRGVGPVAEFLDGLFDTGLGRGPNAGRAVDHPRDRLVAHAGQLARRRPSPASAPWGAGMAAHPGLLTSSR